MTTSLTTLARRPASVTGFSDATSITALSGKRWTNSNPLPQRVVLDVPAIHDVELDGLGHPPEFVPFRPVAGGDDGPHRRAGPDGGGDAHP